MICLSLPLRVLLLTYLVDTEKSACFTLAQVRMLLSYRAITVSERLRLIRLIACFLFNHTANPVIDSAGAVNAPRK